jgi:hypothetical protein
LAASLLLAVSMGAASAVPAGERPDEAAVASALATVKADPNLAGERKTRTLQWDWHPDARDPRDAGVWLRWIYQLFNWVAQSSRILLWAIALVLAAVLVLYLLRIVKAFERRVVAPHRQAAPTHVRELDIRPESLPDDIGAAALEQWERGSHRAALSLLYRGLLSRLVHVHAVPIRASTTEADCLNLSTARLREDGVTYVSQLLRVWQLAVYGGKDPAGDEVQALCANFASALASRSSGAAARPS